MGRRVVTVLGPALLFLVSCAGQALAAKPSKPPPTATTPPPSRVAFTGPNFSIGLIILVALVVLGSVLLAAGRHRRATIRRNS